MSLSLSAKARILSEKRNLGPNLILEIDGIDTIYTAIETLDTARFDAPGLFFDMSGLVFDGLFPIENQEAIISLGGSSNTITQQLYQDKGSVSSVSSATIELLDKDNIATELVSPGVVLPELLGVKARLYINFSGGSHPSDSILIHKGIIDSIDPQAATVKLNIAHPEQQKRQNLFIKASNQLNGAINNSVTTITVDSTTNFLDQSSPELLTYIKIEDEIIRYTGKTPTTFTGCTRGSLGTTAASHSDNATFDSFYRLQDDAISLALKLMLSQAENPFRSEDILYIGAKSPTDLNTSVLMFSNFNIEDQLGLVAGDKVTVSGATNVGNNTSEAIITGFGQTDLGSFVEVAFTFTTELVTSASAGFRSKYDVLSEGMGMTPEDVDVAQHELILDRFSTSIPDYDFYLKDTIKGKDFLAEELYFPAGLYSIPRKAKSSVGITVPGIAEEINPTLNEDNVVNPSSLKSKRTINQNFYNAIVIKYNDSPLDDKFLSGNITFSADSENRIKNTGIKPFTVESHGLRPGGGTDTLIRINSRRWLERYQFAAETILGVKALFKDGFRIEVGDVVVLNPSQLKMTDLDSGSRLGEPKLYEVINKSLNLKTGEVLLDLLSTNFAIDGRYSVVSPTTKVDVGSTTTNIAIKDSFSTTFPNKEKDKWDSFVGQEITVHSQDWSFNETVTLTGFLSGNDYIMVVSPALSVPPAEDYLIDIPYYPNTTNASDASIYKLIFSHFDPEILITSGVSHTSFNVSLVDAGKLFVGAIIRVHNADYSVDFSNETEITSIVGTLVTVTDDLGFTPASGYFIELVGFKDEGLAYRIL